MAGFWDRAAQSAQHTARDTASLDISLDSLETFKKGVDELLGDLEDSAAAPRQMGQDKLKPAHLGTGFGEAKSLMSAYGHVHDQLSTLSQTLADQIESMSMLAHLAKNDYRNVDEEQSARLWAMWRSADQRYRDAARHHRDVKDAAPGTGGGQPQPEESTAGGVM